MITEYKVWSWRLTFWMELMMSWVKKNLVLTDPGGIGDFLFPVVKCLKMCFLWAFWSFPGEKDGNEPGILVKKLYAIWKSLAFRGHCWVILSLPFSLRLHGGHNFLSKVKAESTGHEIVGGSSKACRHFAGVSMCCWWLKNKITPALWQRRQEKSFSALHVKMAMFPLIIFIQKPTSILWRTAQMLSSHLPLWLFSW